MPRYADYDSLPAHIRGMLVAVTKDDDAAERFAHVPHKHLKGKSVMEVINAWFGQRVIERFLIDLGNYLGVDDMERFEKDFGKRR
ncbi:MAG: hypothetical protein AAGD14_02585 [Planctomycetota bacterium]